MLSGNQPFVGIDGSTMQNSILHDKIKPIYNCSYEANDLLKCMLIKDPLKRITIKQILEHPWLANVNVGNRDKSNIYNIIYSRNIY